MSRFARCESHLPNESMNNILCYSIRLSILPLVLMAMFLACGSPTLLTTTHLTQDQLSKLFEDSKLKIGNESEIIEINHVEIGEETIRISFNYIKQDINSTKTDINMIISVEEGELVAGILSGNTQEFDLDDRGIRDIADFFTLRISKAVTGDHQNVEFVAVEIKNQAIIISFRYLP